MVIIISLYKLFLPLLGNWPSWNFVKVSKKMEHGHSVPLQPLFRTDQYPLAVKVISEGAFDRCHQLKEVEL